MKNGLATLLEINFHAKSFLQPHPSTFKILTLKTIYCFCNFIQVWCIKSCVRVREFAFTQLYIELIFALKDDVRQRNNGTYQNILQYYYGHHVTTTQQTQMKKKNMQTESIYPNENLADTKDCLSNITRVRFIELFSMG